MGGEGFTLLIEGRTISSDELRSGNLPELSLFGNSVLSFCQEWTSGKKTFSIITSGSTGPRKEISFQRSELEASAHNTQMALNLKTGDTALLCLNPEFIAGKMMMVRSMVTGMKLIAMAPASDPLRNLPETTIDFAAFVPYQLETILKSEKSIKVLNRISKFIIGGVALKEALKLKITSLASTVYATFGMTETLSHIALQRLNGPAPQPHFHSLPGIKLSKDHRDCLVIESDYLLSKRIVTHDIVILNEDQSFTWLGRADNVINSGGFKIFPEQVEAKLEPLNLESRYFITRGTDEILGSQVVLVLEGEQPHEGLLLTLKQKLKGVLERYEIPKRILFISRFAETATGKIDRLQTLQRLAN